jgi:hypothetical protein
MLLLPLITVTMSCDYAMVLHHYYTSLTKQDGTGFWERRHAGKPGEIKAEYLLLP